MKRVLFGIIAALACCAAHAQPPQEITATDTVELVLGETRTFQFDKPVHELHVAVDGVVQAIPLTDRTISFTALASGEVLVIAYAPDGRIIHSMNITIPGHMVKIYGYPDVKDYLGFMCSDTGCGRIDPDIKPPSSQSITTTRQRRNGDSVSVTKTYP